MNSIQRESMNLRERIEKWAGRHRGASFDFAKELGISYTTVANWLSKRRSLPNEAIRPKICKLLGITEEELLRCFPPQSRGATPPSGLEWESALRTAPVVAEIGGGGFYFMYNTYANEYLPVSIVVPRGKKFAWAKVTSDIMGDYAPAGSYLGVLEVDEAEVREGQMVIIRVGEGSVIGKLHRRGSQVEIKHPTDKSKDVRLPKSALEITGAVVGVYLKK